MARHKSAQLSLENLQNIADEYKSFSQIVVGLVALFAGAVALMVHFSSYQISGIELIFLLIAPFFIAGLLQLVYEFSIRRRVRALERSAVV